MYLYGFELEVKFKGLSGKRQFRWDAAYGRVAVEYMGKGPAHSAPGSGLTRDYDKLTQGQLCGWLVIPCNSDMVNDGRCIEYVERALAQDGYVGETGSRR